MIFTIDIPKNSPTSVKLSSDFDVLRSFLYRVEVVALKHDWKRFLKHLFDLKDVSPVHELSQAVGPKQQRRVQDKLHGHAQNEPNQADSIFSLVVPVE